MRSVDLTCCKATIAGVAFASMVALGSGRKKATINRLRAKHLRLCF